MAETNEQKLYSTIKLSLGVSAIFIIVAAVNLIQLYKKLAEVNYWHYMPDNVYM